MEAKTFKLSDCVRNDLLTLGIENDVVSIEGVEFLFREACIKLTNTSPADNSGTVDKLTGHVYFEAVEKQRLASLYSSLSTFVLAATSNGASQDELEEEAARLGWPEEQAARCAKIYGENLKGIRAVLQMFSSNRPRVVDVDWRLDYEIESSSKGPSHKLMYIIDVMLEEDGRQHSLRFTADRVQLEDLVSSLKDACRAVKRTLL